MVADGTEEGGGYLEQSYNRWLALMKVKIGKTLVENQSMEEFVVLAQKLRNAHRRRLVLSCISGVPSQL